MGPNCGVLSRSEGRKGRACLKMAAENETPRAQLRLPSNQLIKCRLSLLQHFQLRLLYNKLEQNMNQKSLQSTSAYKKGSWTPQEHEQFLQALEHEGTAWPKLQNYVPTRSGSQIRSHAQKYFDKLANKFESKEILGDQFQLLIGPIDDRQYRLYLALVKPRTSSKPSVSAKAGSKPTDSIKYQFQKNTNEVVTADLPPILEESAEETFTNSMGLPPEESFFSKILSQDYSLSQLISVNFYTVFVEVEMLAYRPLTGPAGGTSSSCGQSNGKGFAVFQKGKTAN